MTLTEDQREALETIAPIDQWNLLPGVCAEVTVGDFDWSVYLYRDGADLCLDDNKTRLRVSAFTPWPEFLAVAGALREAARIFRFFTDPEAGRG